MSDPKQTTLDYLNNWRNAQVRITKLESENERLLEVLEAYYHGVATIPCIEGAKRLLADRLQTLEKADG